jgi:mycothiol synthase
MAAELWRGPYAEERFADVIAMKEGCNLMPRGDLELNDDRLTVEQLREYNRELAAKRVQRLTLVVRDLAGGRIAGYTEVYWHPDRAEVMGQGDTAVFPEYQGRGLGRWLKATMLQYARAEWPQVTRVRTGNASSNVPMLKINHEMGFRPHDTHIEWQVETARVRAYLEG